MPTPHNAAQKGDIAKTVLMPGDPLRAKFIAETYLTNPVQFNNVRGMLGFTGSYKGKPVSVMGSGMGMPSIGIYSYELFTMYDVENIVRVGSCGGFGQDMKLFDVLLVLDCYSESTYAKVQGGFEGDVIALGFLNHAPGNERSVMRYFVIAQKLDCFIIFHAISCCCAAFLKVNFLL